MIGFVIFIIVIIIISFFVSRNKDLDDLQGQNASDKFFFAVDVLNINVFNSTAKVSNKDIRTFTLYNGGNQIIEFTYISGNLHIKWKYKYFQKEVIHDRCFSNVRNISIFEQQNIAEQMLREMDVIVQKHQIDVESKM